MAKVEYLNELRGNLSTTSLHTSDKVDESQSDAVELCIDAEKTVASLESSMSTYDSMMQSLNDELNDVAPDLMDFEDVDFFNMDCATAITVDYEINYTIKQLKHIAGYYGIKCRSRKVDMIQDIVIYESDSTNNEIVCRRKRLFHYINALKNDEYLKTFVIM
jgi:hypothetical protein